LAQLLSYSRGKKLCQDKVPLYHYGDAHNWYLAVYLHLLKGKKKKEVMTHLMRIQGIKLSVGQASQPPNNKQ